jgi:uncharacterized protein (TIGR03437 family)
MRHLGQVALGVIVACCSAAGQMTYVVTPSTLTVNGTADSTVVPPPIMFQLTSPTPNTPFAFGSSVIVLSPGPPVMTYGISPTDLIISPSSGVTPATISVSLTTDLIRILYPGANNLELSLYGLNVPLTVNLAAPPPPVVTAVLNAASFEPGVSPGSLISVFGEHIGPLPTAATIGNVLAEPGNVPYKAFVGPILENLVNVDEFNDIPQLYADTGQVNAVLPAEVAGRQSVTVTLIHDGVKAPPFTLMLADAAPAIFTATQNGTGQGAILNQDGSVNGAANPAAVGTVVQIFGNGAGVWSPVLPDGVLVPLAPPYPIPVAKVSVSIGGLPAQVQYAGAAPGLVSGMLQVNAVVPAGLGSGNQPVVLTVGQNNNSSQNVTVAVR